MIKVEQVKSQYKAKKNGRGYFIESCIGIIGVAIITTIFYHYSGELVINSIYSRASAGFLGYVPMNNILNLIAISFVFSLGTLPAIYRYNKPKRKVKNAILWVVFTSLGLIIARVVGDIFMRFVPVEYFGILTGVFISTFIVMNIFTLLTQIKLTQLEKIGFSFILALIALLLNFIFGGLEFVGTWGGVPIFKFITLMLWNIIAGLNLLIISLGYKKEDM